MPSVQPRDEVGCRRPCTLDRPCPGLSAPRSCALPRTARAQPGVRALSLAGGAFSGDAVLLGLVAGGCASGGCAVHVAVPPEDVAFEAALTPGPAESLGGVVRGGEVAGESGKVRQGRGGRRGARRRRRQAAVVLGDRLSPGVRSCRLRPLPLASRSLPCRTCPRLSPTVAPFPARWPRRPPYRPTAALRAAVRQRGGVRPRARPAPRAPPRRADRGARRRPPTILAGQREPSGFAAVVESLMDERAWELPAVGGSVLKRWPDIAAAVVFHPETQAAGPASRLPGLRHSALPDHQADRRHGQQFGQHRAVRTVRSSRPAPLPRPGPRRGLAPRRTLRRLW